MKRYTIKVANLQEVTRLWDENVALHPNDDRWVKWRDKAITGASNQSRKIYITLDGDNIIGEMTAMFYNDDPRLAKGIDRVYLEAFRIKEKYRGKGIFSELHKFAEQDLRSMGYTSATLGVEPEEEYNHSVYNHWGYTKFIKSSTEQYEPKAHGEQGETYSVNYYAKDLLSDGSDK